MKRSLLALLATLTLILPAPGHAAHSGTCQNAITNNTEVTCLFWLRGLPTTIHASVNTTGPASLVGWADIQIEQTRTYTPHLIDCSGSGAGHATCDGSRSAGVFADSATQIYLVTCHFRATGTVTSGSMSCVSGTGA